ncbi:hypothetical protein BGP75_11385 [Motiliproteus sp. MSK22-1]|nr:hypothetical protein BGP75_11385 [Motiliproteus sp. MSK22-1]
MSSTEARMPAKSVVTAQGEVWADKSGKTLYTFAKDEQNVSNCYGPCAQKWPPFIAGAYAEKQGDFSILTRKDGARQWSYKGAPLYSWIKDKNQGETTGHGVKNVWFVARSDDAPVSVFNRGNTQLLTDASQKTLYIFDKDKKDQSNCYDKCATLWPPLQASSNDQASAPFGIIQRKDGSLQWTLNSQPLYTWIKDKQPGDISGDGVKGVWHLARHP